ncbi:class I poly(R)-hydroxyalkanoic acid synthase [Ferrovum sp. PN-J185]|uniref:PHA/PHB synthase family protein n=1 Tax=Ferrovum sp. PN-J185 TaxID=1356306 RepID=UPI00079626D6|nr:class I poly(R)-hydroxyalkanoic acid synthase [Ferrovum sp. PN-J185]KXW56338.1 poly-beta-hydroxybutyrate polymerase [Ferrovum sp. PN-J185]MCC6069062.1 class I poly(R)-hydroxyalkanoic acid synthase [Ferrovum sp. PN-J185]MDE1890958.1 class I poly(R)-hydroxyalkanoic acid synthase [Betaproteobacteria bacterium]MDE2055730.1 class I poly(R)-hydroxyalkanoic acid synthase [Betaproteobacteria bacterium]
MNNNHSAPDSHTDSVEKLVSAFSDANHTMAENVSNLFGGYKPEDYEQFLKKFNEAVIQDLPRWQELQARYYQNQLALWINMAEKAATGHSKANAFEINAEKDKRFSSPPWRDNLLFDYYRQSYLLTAQWLKEVVSSLNLDDKSKDKLDFFTQQFVDALSPSNYPATNPEVLMKAIETGGDSLRKGFENLLQDIEKGRISMTDESVFEVGRNIATTPGAVVFQNDIFQLIQYLPQSEQVFKRPLLLIPPCINKFYIMDLGVDNSFVRFAVEQGHTVFMVSWKNVTEEQDQLRWDDYVEHGVIRAIKSVQSISQCEKMDVLGFCVGGALLATAVAAFQKKETLPIATLTFLTTLLDYSDVGDIGMYINRNFVERREQQLSSGGLISGKELAMAFSSLRPNDLVWPYVVNNYLKGETPPAFDLLFWNSDGTNLPGPMFAWYLRHFYLENRLRTPNTLTVCGEQIDLGTINYPTYIFAAKEDHIVPWHTAFRSLQLLGGQKEFVLGASGHIAGTINSAKKNKRNYWIDGERSMGPQHWFETAVEHKGSWWWHWIDWLKVHNQEPLVSASSVLGNDEFKELEAAPGHYVKEKC